MAAIRKTILFALSIAMVAVGLYVLAAQLFWSHIIFGRFLLMGAFLTWAGLYLLWSDFIEPVLGVRLAAIVGVSLIAIAVVAIVGWTYPTLWVVILAGTIMALVCWYGVVLNLRAVLRLMRQRPERRGDEGA